MFGLLAFLLTGQYMHWHLHVHGMPDGPRLMYRSAHIYLLWASLLNIAFSAQSFSANTRRMMYLQVFASVMLAATPTLVLASFLLESANQDLTRPFARLAIYCGLAGVLLHVSVRYFATSSAQDM
jgi:hypothetical protein